MIRPAAALLALALAAPAAHAQQPNLLFILSEDMGPQISHPAYAEFATAQVQTPNLDALAARGFLFPNAHITTPVCSASRTGVLTGLHNNTNRIRGNTQNYFYPMTREESDAITDPTYRQASIPREYPTMIELLRDAGYHTGVSQKLHMSPNDKLPYDDWIVAVNGQTVQTVVSNAQAAGKPWMLMYGPSNAHAPFSQQVAANIDPALVVLPDTLPDTPAARNMWARYLSEIQRVDGLVGQAMDKLTELGQWDNTFVVFMGDHGTGVPGAKTTPYDLGTRTPLMICGPGIPAGVVSPQMVSTVDLMPTLLDLLGIERPEVEHGHSLAGYLTQTAPPPPRDYVVSEVFGANIGDNLMRERTITDGQHRLILRWRVNDPRAFNIDMFKVGYGGDPTNGDTYRDIVENRAADPGRFTWLARMHNFRFKTLNPQYQMHHTAADRFERVDILEDPAAAATRSRLLVALHAWAHRTNDIDSPLQDGFAAEAILDPFEPVQVMNEDDANHPSTQYVKYIIHTGALEPDPDWRTRAFGNTGSDFTMTGGILDAPPGPAPLATHESLRLMPGQGFTATVKTRFAGVGVGGGLVFGFQDSANYWSLQLLDGNTTVGGANKDARLVRVVGGVEQVLQLVSDLPNITANEWYTVRVTLDPATNVLALRIDDPAGEVYFSGTRALAEPLPAFSLFGVNTWASNNSQFNDFSVSLTAASFLPGDFDGDGELTAEDFNLLRGASGQATGANARFNLALPDDVVDEDDAREWATHVYPAVTGQSFSAAGTGWAM